jgi:uncharacterized protein (UPF0305 family)
MKSSELFLKLKRDVERYKPKITLDEQVNGNDENSIHYMMSKYNFETFNEILNSYYPELDDEVSLKDLNDFKSRIDQYFKLYAPDDEEFKEFIKLISIYLTFIAKKPLHPPGIRFSKGATVYKRGNVYYCTGKSVFMKDQLSLCKYCVCSIE